VISILEEDEVNLMLGKDEESIASVLPADNDIMGIESYQALVTVCEIAIEEKRL
jgi:hypothetical protein